MVPAELYGLQLNQDISEALIIGTANQLHPVSSAVASVSIAGVDLRTLADKMKVLGVVLDQRLTFAKHVMAVARSCNYHTQAIRHICHLLSTNLATTLDTVPARLLQLATTWSSDWQYLDITSCAEQCNHRPAGSMVITRTAVTASTALAASSSQK